MKYCQTNEEFGCARRRMHDCYFNKATTENCLKPCKEVRYNAIQMEGEIDEEIKEKNLRYIRNILSNLLLPNIVHTYVRKYFTL